MTKSGIYNQNPIARSKSYWELGAHVPTQFPRLLLAQMKVATIFDKFSFTFCWSEGSAYATLGSGTNEGGHYFW